MELNDREIYVNNLDTKQRSAACMQVLQTEHIHNKMMQVTDAIK